MSWLICWVTMTHTARHHAQDQSIGSGHLYQGRFKSKRWIGLFGRSFCRTATWISVVNCTVSRCRHFRRGAVSAFEQTASHSGPIH